MKILELISLLRDCHESYGDLEMFVVRERSLAPFIAFKVEDHFMLDEDGGHKTILLLNA